MLSINWNLIMCLFSISNWNRHFSFIINICIKLFKFQFCLGHRFQLETPYFGNAKCFFTYLFRMSSPLTHWDPSRWSVASPIVNRLFKQKHNNNNNPNNNNLIASTALITQPASRNQFGDGEIAFVNIPGWDVRNVV